VGVEGGFCYATVVTLNVQDVNMTTGAVIIRSGKGGKFRTAFMGASTSPEVLCYLRRGTENAGRCG
jgi:site-specific recombinase XerD